MPLPVFVLACAALLAAWAAYTYNFLIHARAKVREARSGVDVQLRLRHDLVPALNAVVREYAEHEREALRIVAARRSRAIAADGTPELVTAENALAAGISELLAVAERYPGLKAAEQFRSVALELVGIEDELQSARQLHNANVEFYNSRAQAFPTVVIAGFMSPREFGYLLLDAVEFDAGRLGVGEFAA